MKSSLERNVDAVFKKAPSDSDVLGLLPDRFTERVLAEQAGPMIKPEAAAKAGGVSRDDVLRKYNIIHPDEKSLDKMLDGIVNGTV
jgi:hypothetical protein